MSNCPICNHPKYKYAKTCKKCFLSLKNPFYKHGKYTKQNYCKECNTKTRFHNKHELCQKCYFESIKTKPNLCKCGNIKSFYAIECSNCSFKKRVGESNPNWRGGKAKYDSLWLKNRILVLKRDNYTCQCCLNRGGILNVHHIKSIKNFMYNELEKAHDLSNLITLCRKCHNKTHDLI